MHLPDYNAGHVASAATPPQAPAARRSGRCRCAFLRRLDAGEPAGPACDTASACHSSGAPVRSVRISADGSICDAKCGSSLPRNLPLVLFRNRRWNPVRGSTGATVAHSFGKRNIDTATRRTIPTIAATVCGHASALGPIYAISIGATHFRFAFPQRIGPGLEVVLRSVDVRLTTNRSSDFCSRSSDQQCMTRIASTAQSTACQKGLRSFTGRPMLGILPW